MPIILTFDIQGAPPVERNRIQSAFERLHWQRLGGSAYRYPALGSVADEDWLNHVVPAFMLFREYLLASGRLLTKFTIDAQTSTGGPIAAFNPNPTLGNLLQLSQPTNVQFGAAQLREWLLGVGYPY